MAVSVQVNSPRTTTGLQCRTRRRYTDESIWPEAPRDADSLERAKPGKLHPMLQAEECQRRADECARLADATVNSILIARYRHLEASWRSLRPLVATDGATTCQHALSGRVMFAPTPLRCGRAGWQEQCEEPRQALHS